MNGIDGGVHVVSTLLVSTQGKGPDSFCLRLTIFPLPNDEDLLLEMSVVAKDAVNAVLVRRGVCSGQVDDITDRSGRVQ